LCNRLFNQGSRQNIAPKNSPPTRGWLTWTGDRIKQLKTPLLDRRGAVADERSESDAAGWWNQQKKPKNIDVFHLSGLLAFIYLHKCIMIITEIIFCIFEKN